MPRGSQATSSCAGEAQGTSDHLACRVLTSHEPVAVNSTRYIFSKLQAVANGLSFLARQGDRARWGNMSLVG